RPTKKVSRRVVIAGLATLGLAAVGGGMELWIFTPHPLYTYRGHSGSVNAVVWSPAPQAGLPVPRQGGGSRIVSGSSDETVQVWDADTGNLVCTYRGHFNSVDAMSWSPSGTRIASGGSDNTVQVWDATDGSPFYTYRGHSDIVNAVSWSPDGKHLASAGNDKTVQVWDA